jgi:hypothetical protein
MSTAPLTTPTAETTSPQQDMLNDLAALGHRLARLVVEQAEALVIPAVKAATAFDRVTRSIRRCLWLASKVAEPIKTIDRIAARKQIIRKVEDTIQRHADHPDDAESLHEELMDRLDTPDLEDEIRGRPLGDIIDDIIRDLGLAAAPGSHPWKRRTPDDLAELHARAAQPVPSIDRMPATAPAQTEAPYRARAP